MLDQAAREEEAGRRLKLDYQKLARFIVLGVLASASTYALLTAGREPRVTDFVWSGLAGLKGAEILTVCFRESVAADLVVVALQA